MAIWNPWHGCKKISAGCQNCYVYRTDAKYEKDSTKVAKTQNFDLPIKRNRAKEYKLITKDNVYTCFTSDFFLEEADEWRSEVWRMIKERSDLKFLIVTKRIHRFSQCIPDDWGDGYENVTLCCTVENEEMANFRLPIFMNEPIKHKMIVCEPLLGKIDLSPYLSSAIELVLAGGESGNEARVCDFDWVLDIRKQCIGANVTFHFKQTGAKLKKGGQIFNIKRKDQHSQAKKANIDFTP